MNQLCKVCGEPAAGFHFGAFTCEGCKSFFGRTYNNISAIAGCKNNGDCVINKKNRTACKACRLRKCLLVGMSKSGSRYGRRSNWFKIHCLLQEQQSTANNLTGLGIGGSGGGGQTAGGGGSGVGNNNTCNLEQLARLQQASSQARQTYQDKTNPCIKSAASALSPTLALQAAAAAAAASAAAAAAAASSGSTTTTTHGLSSVTANAALNLPHFLQAAKFLNGQHNHHHHHQHHQQHQHQQQTHNPHFKHDSRLSNTPSDSGASSAGDPNDDCNSLTYAKGSAMLTTTTTTPTSTTTAAAVRQRNCNSVQPPLESLQDSNERRRKELLEIFRSHSEPLRSAFAPFALPPSLLACTPPTPTPTHTLHMQHQQQQQQPATALADFKAARHTPTTQDEPIDLSLKSNRTSRTPTPSTSPASVDALDGLAEERTTPTSTRCCADASPNAATAAAFVRKSTPLDLTLVRSTQTLTG